MRLSEAIRAGAKLGPQVFGSYWNSGGTCALGAAGMATPAAKNIGLAGLAEVYPIVLRSVREDDVPDELRRRIRKTNWILGPVITELNDELRWSREAIAEWVATIEDKYTRDVVDSEEVRDQPQAEEANLAAGKEVVRT